MWRVVCTYIRLAARLRDCQRRVALAANIAAHSRASPRRVVLAAHVQGLAMPETCSRSVRIAASLTGSPTGSHDKLY